MKNHFSTFFSSHLCCVQLFFLLRFLFVVLCLILISSLLLHDLCVRACLCLLFSFATGKVAAGGLGSSAKDLDTGVAGSQEWRLQTSRSEATYSENESYGSSVENDERDISSEKDDVDYGKGGETGKASGGGKDEKAASKDGSDEVDEVEAEAAGTTSRLSYPK